MTFVESASSPREVMPPMIHEKTPVLVPSMIMPSKDFQANPPPVDPVLPVDRVLLAPVSTAATGRVVKLADDDEGDDLDDDIEEDAGFVDPAEAPSPGFGDDLDDDDEVDEFDDIDEDDFDDDFDDDFEEELEDDYEIEIDDEISTEFGLNTAGEKEEDDVDELDDFEDFDKIAR